MATFVPWGDEELDYLREHPNDWEGHRARFGRSYHSWRTKRKRLGLVEVGRDLAREQLRERAGVVPMVDLADQDVGSQTVKGEASEDDYDEFFALLEAADELKERLSPTQESTEFCAPDDGLPVGIAFTGDWHLGASGVEYARLDQDLSTIRDTEGLYAVGMGDYVEGVTLASKAASSLFSGAFNAGDLQERALRRRAGLVRGKWLALMAGNHDEWMAKVVGMTRTDKVASYLGAPYFCQGGGTIFAQVGDQRYVVAVTHNAKGNSRLNTTNAHRVTFDRWPTWENCDVIVCGHLHYNDEQTASRKGGRCVYLRSGTAKTRDGYAADNGFTPEYGIPIAILLPDRRFVRAFRGDDFREGVQYLGWLRERYRNGERL